METKSENIKTLTGKEFDELAESGKDISDYLDWDNATRGDSKRINIDMPSLFLAALDREAAHRGITRQSLIKSWLYDRLMIALSSSLIRSSEASSEIQSVPQLKQTADNRSSVKSSPAIVESLIGKSQSAEGARSLKRKVSTKK